MFSVPPSIPLPPLCLSLMKCYTFFPSSASLPHRPTPPSPLPSSEDISTLIHHRDSPPRLSLLLTIQAGRADLSPSLPSPAQRGADRQTCLPAATTPCLSGLPSWRTAPQQHSAKPQSGFKQTCLTLRERERQFVRVLTDLPDREPVRTRWSL